MATYGAIENATPSRSENFTTTTVSSSSSSQTLSVDDDSDSERESRSFETIIDNARAYSSSLAIPATLHGEAIASDESLRYHPTIDTEAAAADTDSVFSKTSKDVGKKEVEFHGGVTRRQFWLIFACILTANFVAAFDGTIMSSTHTSITSTFHSSNSASWLSTSFLLTSTSLQPLFGRVSDCIGRKSPFLFSLWVFIISTLWCAVAGSMESIVAARAVCGLGAGGMMCMGAIILSDILPLEVRAGYQSVNNLSFGVGSALGAAVGGAIADYMGWRWGFAVQIPPAILCIVLCKYNLPNQAVEKGRDEGMFAKLKDFDFAGSVYLTLCVGILVLALNTGGNLLPWSHPLVLGSIAVSFFFTILFLRAEHRAISPIMPLHLLQKNPRASMMLGSVASSISVQTIFFNIPLFFQTVMLESARKAGSRLLIPTVGNMLCSVGVGYIINRTKVVRPTMRFGSITLFFGGLGLMFLSPSFSELAICLLLIPANAGVGLAYPSIMMGTLASSEQHEMAVATSTLILFRSIGNVMGVSTSSLIVQNALVWGLKRNLVVGNTAGLISEEQKSKIIEMVRERVTAIFDLQGEIQQQVIEAYNVSLRMTFGWATLCAFIMVCAVYNLVIPRMDNKKKRVEEAVDWETTETTATEETSLLRGSK